MERLTQEGSTKCSMDPWDWCGLDRDCKRDCFEPTPCPIPIMARRLAEYEDTGMTPEEIKTVQDAVNPIPFGRFREIMEAERDGRCVVLPPYEEPAGDGFKVKYRVYKARNGEPVEGCMVLRPDKDFASRMAIKSYAAYCGNPELAEDLRLWMNAIENSLGMLRPEAEAVLTANDDTKEEKPEPRCHSTIREHPETAGEFFYSNPADNQ